MITPLPVRTDEVPLRAAEARLFGKLTCAFGILAMLTALAGIAGNISGNILLSSVCTGCKTMALSASICWIFFGAFLVWLSVRPVGRTACLVLRAALVVIACMEAAELILSFSGRHFIVESWSVAAGSVLFGPLSTPISPEAAGLIVIAAIGLFIRVDPASLLPENRGVRNGIVLAGLILAVAGFTFVLSYFYGNPLILGSHIIPIAAISALAAFFTGAGLIAAAGPETSPVCYFTGTSIRAMLLRNFVTLTVAITFCETVIFYIFASWYPVSSAIEVSVSLVAFILATAWISGRLSTEIGQKLDRAERALLHRNEEMGELNEELLAVEEELRQNIDALTTTEQDLRESEQRFMLALRHAPVSVASQGPDLVFRWAYNQRTIRPENVAGLRDEDIFLPEDAARLVALKRRVLETGTAEREKIWLTVNGKRMFLDLYLEPQLDADGRIAGVGIATVDLTEQELAVQAAQESGEKLKKETGKLDILAESARLLLSTEKPEHIVRIVGERVMRYLHCHVFFNYLIDDTGKGMQLNACAGIPPEDVERVQYLHLGEAVCGQVARDGERIVIHDICGNDDERCRLVRTFGVSGYACHPILYQGRILGTLSFGRCDAAHFTDDELELMRAVTDLVATAMARKKVEDTLRGTSQYLESLINYANAPIIVWDRDLNIQRFNHAFEFLTGMAADTVLGEPLDILFPEQSRHESMELISKTGSGERWESVEIPIRHVSGTTRIVLWNSANIHDTDGVTILSTIAQGQDITERKIAEETALHTASLLNAALDSTADGILVVDRDGKITSYNTTFCEIWGIPGKILDAAEEKTALAYMTPLIGDPREFAARLKELYAHPGRESYDMVSLANGRIFERYSKPQKIGDTIVGRVWSYRDITERKRSEEQLHRAQERTAAILESIADTFYSLDSQWRFITANPAAEKAPFGRPAAELLGRVIWELYPSLVGTRIQQHYFDAARKHSLEHYEAQSPLDGRWYEIFMQGREEGVDVYMRDITGRRHAEEALRESLEKFRIIATNTPDHILVQDRELRYTQVINPQMGLTGEDMIGKNDYNFLSREDAEKLTKIKRHVMESGTAYSDEIPLVDARGETNYFAGSYVPKRNEAGEIEGIIGYFRNVTEAKLANERIVAALAEKEILIREIHHRVKNNLQIISGLLDMTRMRTGDPATTGILTDMMMKIKTMAQIHTRLYESRQFDRVSMGGQIRDQAADLSSIYGRSGPEISCHVDAEDLSLPVDQAIPCALIVNEALSNAFKHAFRGRMHGEILVSARQEDGNIHISIRDNGTGIPKDVDISRGTSLGLKLIRSLVQQLHGTLEIESTDQGSVVDVSFPAKAGG